MTKHELCSEMDPQGQLASIENRDLQLWSMVALLFVIGVAAFLAIVLPNVMWGSGTLKLEGAYLPQIIFGLVTLVVLFNLYLARQRSQISRARRQLVGQLAKQDFASWLDAMDPLTETLSRRSMDSILARETSRAEQKGSPLTILLVDMDDFRDVNTRLGHLGGDRALAEVGRILKQTFRASDLVFRYGGDEFLVLLTDTDERGAHRACERLFEEVTRWNAQPTFQGYNMRLSCGVAMFESGKNVQDVIQQADENMYSNKAERKRVPSLELVFARN